METPELTAEIRSYTIIEKIAEGRSGDEKYKLEKGGKYFLLRIGDRSRAAERKRVYDRLKIYADNGINTNKPVAFGITHDRFYSIVSWVGGTSVMDIIKGGVSKNHYRLGKMTGIELQKLHSFCLDYPKADWQDVIEKRAALFLENYHRMDIEVGCAEHAERFIWENTRLAANRPQTVLHGDFHWNNCVADEAGNIGIIDFSGNDIGDPWYDLCGLLWASEYSDSYVNGQIDGYFGTPPSGFWGVFKLYAALYAFEHIMYNNGNAEDIMNRISNAERMLRTFGGAFESEQPLFRKQIGGA